MSNYMSTRDKQQVVVLVLLLIVLFALAVTGCIDMTDPALYVPE